jgi:hypothetical protein
LNLLGVTGSNSAPVIPISLQVESQPAFRTEIAAASSNFNLLCVRDVSRVYDINISSGRVKLIPRGTAAGALNTISNPVVPTPPFNLNESQLKTAVLLVTILLIISVIG